jgi:hypothetical protein
LSGWRSAAESCRADTFSLPEELVAHSEVPRGAAGPQTTIGLEHGAGTAANLAEERRSAAGYPSMMLSRASQQVRRHTIHDGVGCQADRLSRSGLARGHGRSRQEHENSRASNRA